MIKICFFLALVFSCSQVFSYNLPRLWVPKHYKNTRQINEWANELAGKYPEIIKLKKYGSSVKGEKRGVKNLFALEISHKDYIQKSVFLITAGIHPRELLTIHSAVQIVNDIIQEIENGNTYWLEYIKKVKIIVIPLLNPDGYDKVMQGWNWRKSVRKHYALPITDAPNSYGVDLNGNFDVNFQRVHPVKSLEWGGPKPFSEPETRSLRDYLLGKKITASIALHSYGRYIAFPWWGNLRQRIPDHDLHAKIGRKVMSFMKGYRLQKGCPYLVPGNFGDWIYARFRAFAYTVEIGDHFNPDKKTGTKWYNEIMPGVRFLMDYIYKKAPLPVEKSNENRRKKHDDFNDASSEDVFYHLLNRNRFAAEKIIIRASEAVKNSSNLPVDNEQSVPLENRVTMDDNRFRLVIVPDIKRENLNHEIDEWQTISTLDINTPGNPY